jgi:membrane protein DedA with SNARE-associated domain
MSDEIRDDWNEERNLALAYGSLAGLVWGLVVSLRAFFAPLTMTWGQWCTMLLGGIAVALVIPLVAVALLRWTEGWRASRRRAVAR